MVLNLFSTAIFIIYILLIGLVIAVTTTFLFFIIWKIPLRKTRFLVLVISCIALYWVVPSLNNQGNYIVFLVSVIGCFVLNCTLILLPFPLFERAIQRISHKYVVFFGAFIITITGMGLFASRTIDVRIFFSLLMIPFVLFPVGIVFISLLVFTAITLISWVLVKSGVELHFLQTSELGQTIPEKSNNIEFALLLLIVIITPFVGVYGPGLLSGSPTGYVSITKINESIVPTGTIYHLSEKDFQEFPGLAKVIRDNTREDKVYYGIALYGEEREKFINNFPFGSTNRTTGQSETYFEYKGKFYSFDPPMIE